MICLNDPKFDDSLAWFCLREECMKLCSDKSKKIAYDIWRKAYEIRCIEAEKIMARQEKEEKKENLYKKRNWYDD